MAPTKKALYLSYFTVVYNVVEGLVCVLIGASFNSVALLGFGLDSFVESLSGAIMIWRFWGCEKLSKDKEETAERKAVKLIGWTFFVLGFYILYESVKKIYFHEISQVSWWGIAIAVISILVMIFSYKIKRELGKEIKSHGLLADANQALACMAMSVSLLIGLAVNYFWGLWWADPLVGIIIALLLLREGIIVIRTRNLCDH